MRKAFVLMVLLAAASAADATLTIVAPSEMSFGDPAEVGIDVVGEPALLACALVTSSWGALQVDSSQATIAELGIGEFVVETADDPDMLAFLADLGITHVVSAVYFEAIDVSATPRSIPDGPLISNVFLTMVAEVTGTLSLVDVSAGKVLASQDMQILVPPPPPPAEPVTIALLGLGALFVRRRR